MTTKTTSEMATGAGSAKNEKTKKVATKKAGKVTGVTVIELIENTEPQNPNNAAEQSKEVAATFENKTKTEAKVEKKVVADKSAKPVTKKVGTVGKTAANGEKKIKLAATCYHYYRNWLKDFLRSYAGGVSSARFQKSAESYDGHIVVLESEKVKGLKALEAWNKQNPDTKEMFWDVKK